MNTKRLLTIILVFLLVLTACDVRREIIKKVNRDGSIDTKISVWSEDTTLLYKRDQNPFPVKTDNLWKLSFIRDSFKKIRCTAIRKFPDAENLNKIFRFNNSNWENLPHKLIVERKFRWFCTYFSYLEIFGKADSYKVPVEKYLTENELKIWTDEGNEVSAGKDSIAKEKIKNEINIKAEKWYKACVTEELAGSLKKAVILLNEPSIQQKMIDENIDTILTFYTNDWTVKKLATSLASYFHNDKFLKLLDKKYDFLNDIEKKNKTFIDYFHEETLFKTIIPGKLINTNARKINHDTLSWKVNAYKFIFKEYELKAGSRVINWWAFWVTGIIIFLALIIKFLSNKIRKNNEK